VIRTFGRPIARSGFVLQVILLLSLAVSSGSAQEGDLYIQEIPLVHRLPVSARYAGMGGTSLAIADDHSACLANPATLGLVRGIEFSAGFARQDAERSTVYFGNPRTADYGKTRLTDLGFAYPFPTYRGRFVIGFQYGRVSGLDSKFLQSAGFGPAREEVSITERGGLQAYAVSAALQVSPSVTLGATGTVLGGSSLREIRAISTNPPDPPMFVRIRDDAEISGFSGILGGLVELDHGVRFGFTINLPENVDFDIDFAEYYTTSSEPDTTGFGVYEVDIPFRLGAGLAVARKSFLVSIDAVYTDWTQIDVADLVAPDASERSYRETLEIRLGAEYFLPLTFPIRLRAGYQRQPLPYRLILTDSSQSEVIPPRATIDHDRDYFTFGAGFLIGKTITLDVAYMHGGFERSAPQGGGRYVEEETDRRMLATMTLRLN
jgi:long-subunit fatty acid transport protein